MSDPDNRTQLEGQTCKKRGCSLTVIASAHLPSKMFCGNHFTDVERYV